MKYDLTGMVFSRLTVLSEAPKKRRDKMWKCRCECGAEKDISSNHLVSGFVKSCGCLKVETTRKRATTHGQGGRFFTRTYLAWKNMVLRVENPRSKAYPRYGGRGIRISEEMRRFNGFFEILGTCPEGMELERINNDGHYESGNVRWATKKEQGRNKSTNRILTANGKSQPLVAWAEELGIPRARISARLKYGYSVEQALFSPLSRAGKRLDL